MSERIAWGARAPMLCDGEFGDGYWRIFTREPCWPANGQDTWGFCGGPAFATEAHAQRYLERESRQ